MHWTTLLGDGGAVASMLVAVAVVKNGFSWVREKLPRRRRYHGRHRRGEAYIWVNSSPSFSSGNCVEVASMPDGEIGVRNSKDPGGPVLRFTSDEWQAFVGGVRNGGFDNFGRK